MCIHTFSWREVHNSNCFLFSIVPIKCATVNNLGQRIIVEEAVIYKHIGGLEEGSYVLLVKCFSRDTREAKLEKRVNKRVTTLYALKCNKSLIFPILICHLVSGNILVLQNWLSCVQIYFMSVLSLLNASLFFSACNISFLHCTREAKTGKATKSSANIDSTPGLWWCFIR